MNTQKFPWEDESPHLPESTPAKSNTHIKQTDRAAEPPNPQPKQSGRRPSSHSSEFKLSVILETLRGNTTQREVGQKYNVPQPLVSLWKSRAINAIRDALDGGKKLRVDHRDVAGPLDRLMDASDEHSIESLCANLRKTASLLEVIRKSHKAREKKD